MEKDDRFIIDDEGNKILLDEDDAPELSEDFFTHAKPAPEVLAATIGKDATENLMKGKVGRPVSDNPKRQITLRLDADVIEAFRSHGKGWQTEINQILRQWVENRPDS